MRSTTHDTADQIRIATKQHYIKAVQIQLAKIIAGLFWKAISSWPTPDLADSINLLAEAESENFRRQLASSLSHARGVHCIDPTGEKEKSIATELRSRADQLQKTCPTAASVLRDVAKSLDSEAIRNVERAEWEQ